MTTTTDRQPVRIGVIGIGQIGKHHLENHSKIADVNLVAVADVNEAEAHRVAQKYNIPSVYTDFRELLQRDDIEAVDVCLHNNFHAPVTIAALQAGKNVYCEKPMAGSYHDAEEMMKVAQETGRKLAIQMFTPFKDETKAAKSLIDAGYLGKLYHARSVGHRRRGRPFVDGYGTSSFVQKEIASGGALYDVGIYHIAQVLYLLGNPTPLTISGATYQEIPMDEKRREISRYNVEELALGFVRLQGGITLDILESWAMHVDKMDGSIVVGSEGGVRLEPFGFFHAVGHLDLNSTVDLERFDWRLNNVGENGDAYESSQRHWVAGLQGRVELIPTAAIALNAMLISEGIYLSQERGHEVTAEEVKATSQSTALKV